MSINKTRLQACIEALEALKIPKEQVSHFQSLGANQALEKAIAIVTRILSAEPSEEEIEKACHAYAKDQFDNQEDNIGCCRESIIAALMAVFGGREG